MDRITDLIAGLGLPIRDRDLVLQALTHASWLHEHAGEAPGHNERLEFLGDAVISQIVSEELYGRHPADDEGALSSRRAAIVSSVGLGRIATRIHLGDALRLGAGEASRGGRVRPLLLASALEALVGAVFLDLGWETTRRWFLSIAGPELASVVGAQTLKSPKSRLQEWTQRRTGTRPQYVVLEESGPDHEKLFRIDVLVDGTRVGSGSGPSRRIAETAAAAEAISRLRVGAADPDAPVVDPAVPAGRSSAVESAP